MNKILGQKGEFSAKTFLKKNSYKIKELNYTNKIGEIDIIAIDKSEKIKTLVFIEVKYRQTAKFGLPREAVNSNKQQKIKMVATAYLQKHNLLDAKIRFDVIDILTDTITHIKNAF